MQKFNTNTIVSSYIKELLKDFNLPRVRVWLDNEPHIDGCIYLKGLEFVKYENDNLTKVGDYVYNKKCLNITHTLINNSLLYDSNTHKYLGEYLRFLRDYRQLDLMSMYNCITNEFPTNMSLTIGSNVTIDSSDNDYTIYMANVSAFHEYTIAIDCSEKIELFAGYYSNGLYKVVTSNNINPAVAFYLNTYEQHVSNRHQHPFVYSKLKNSSIFTKERLDHNYNLYLFIKVPSSCNSSVVVLEGNYLDNCNYTSSNNSIFREIVVPNKTISSKEDIVDLKSSYELGEYISRPQLLAMSTTSIYPFADRLVEYLVENTITHLDTIRDDIVRVQKTYVSSKFEETYGYSLDNIEHYGLWTESLRQLTYKLAMTTNKLNSKFDIIGYIDKDMETYIGD